MIDFTGKTVIITGGLSGAGRAITEVFLESGADVIVTYNHSAGAEQELRGRWPDRNIRCIHLDQSDIESIEEFLGEVRELCGSADAACGQDADSDSDSFARNHNKHTQTGRGVRIDALVNNAGIYPAKHIDEIEPDEWDEMMDTNARGVFFLARGIARLMQENGGGSIINISSINATNPARYLAHYGASKAAVEMMTRSLAQEYGHSLMTDIGDGSSSGDNMRGVVRCNCIAPGLIYKGGQDKFIPGWTDSYRERSALGKLVDAEEIGKTCLFLASDLASAITGQTITVDAGVSLAPYFYNEL